MNWISISDQPPPVNTRLLLTDSKTCLIGQIKEGCKWPFIEGIYGDEWSPDFECNEITHWMLAPELP